MIARISYHADDAASRAIAAADLVMAKLIAEIRCVTVDPPPGGGLELLVRTIAGQQLSGAAADAIFRQVEERVGVSANELANATLEELHEAGLSRQKARYVQGLAAAVASGGLDLDALEALDDDAAIARLSQLEGVGPWTAQVYLIFALGRPDVLLADDVGVRSSAGVVFGLGRPMTREEIVAAAERWRPYRSAATLYLWSRGRMNAGRCEERPAG